MARVSIEDCQKHMPNRFVLVLVAANRARQLMSSSVPLVSSKNKVAVTALREIAEGKVSAKHPYVDQEKDHADILDDFDML